MAADGRGESFSLLAEGTSLLCDCASLVPFAARPQYPRVHSGGRELERSDRCVYNPGGTMRGEGPLVVRVQKAASKITYDETVNALLASYPKVEDRSRAEVTGGEATTAFGVGSMGVDVLGIVYMPRERLVLTTEEHFSARPQGENARAGYLAGLVTGAVPACL